MRDFELADLEAAAKTLTTIADLLEQSMAPTVYEPGVIRIANPDPEGIRRHVRALRDIARRRATPKALAQALAPYLADSDDVDEVIAAAGLDALAYEYAEACLFEDGCVHRAAPNGYCHRHQPELVTT